MNWLATWLHGHRQAAIAALQRLAATPLNTLLAVLAMGVSLALPALGEALLANGRGLAERVAPTLEISLFLTPEAGRAAADEVRRRLTANPRIKRVRFLAREETLTRMKMAEGLGDVIEALPRNPFPDAFTIRPADTAPAAMDALAADLRKLPQVEHVQLDSAWTRRLDALLRLGRMGTLLLAGLLGLGVVAIAFSTARLQVSTRTVEIDLSRLLGATDAFIRRPFLWTGVFQGLLAAVAALAIVFSVSFWLRTPAAEAAALYGLELQLQWPGPDYAAILLATGAVLGWLGTTLSLRQFLVNTR
ncbi:MAG: ABC transporter permease [Rhodocyclaceae bacterium]|nr:ABC transporter permease [Rhodocyclaceae bacterium]